MGTGVSCTGGGVVCVSRIIPGRPCVTRAKEDAKLGCKCLFSHFLRGSSFSTSNGLGISTGNRRVLPGVSLNAPHPNSALFGSLGKSNMVSKSSGACFKCTERPRCIFNFLNKFD